MVQNGKNNVKYSKKIKKNLLEYLFFSIFASSFRKGKNKNINL